VQDLASRLEALRGENVRELEARCRTYESVLSGRQRRRAEALIADGQC